MKKKLCSCRITHGYPELEHMDTLNLNTWIPWTEHMDTLDLLPGPIPGKAAKHPQTQLAEAAQPTGQGTHLTATRWRSLRRGAAATDTQYMPGLAFW